MPYDKFKMFLWGSIFFCCGCIDNAYDLNKEINKEVSISGNKLTVPVSNFKPIVLDSLIDVDDIDLMEITNGVYSLYKSDVIDPITIEIDPIKINIDPITHTSTFQFDEVTIEEAVLNEVTEEQTFGINDISIEDLNESLPKLETQVTKELYTPEMKEQIEALKNSGLSQEMNIPLNEKFSTGNNDVAFGLEYDLPKEIKEITDIKLNNLIQFKVTNPRVLDGVNKTISLTATFPDKFTLRKDPSAPESDKYSLIGGNIIKVDGITAEGESTIIQFYIDEITELSSNNGHISIDDKITYNVDYSLNGNFVVSANTNLEDLTFLVSMDHQVSFTDAKGSTNDIDVEFENMEFDFSAHFDNLEHIKEVEYIEFDASQSKIKFVTDLGHGGFEPFNLKQGYELKLLFPENFVLDLSQCKMPNGTEYDKYDKNEHAFYISDINALNHFEWELAIDRIDVYKEVVNHTCDLDAKATISVSSGDGVLKLGETDLESLNETLENLKDKDVVFTMQETHLHIDDAVVLTEVIHEEIEEHTSFSVNEKIDDGVKRIENVEFKEEVPITLEVSLTGIEDLETTVHLELDVELPSFFKIEPGVGENRAYIKEDGTLAITTDYDPKQGEPLIIHLLGKRLDFSGEEFIDNTIGQVLGIVLKDSTDGNRYLQYDSEIPIEGEAFIDESELHSYILGKEIGINVDFTIEEIEVQKFSGIYCGEIDDIHESIDFDLGEDLDFLTDDVNSLTFSDPQIMFTIDNPVGVPVDMALSLFGKDKNGNPIESSRTETTITIEPAAFEGGEVVTRKLQYLLTNKPVERVGYINVVIPGLSNLLKKIPDALEIELIPTINESQTHHVDLYKEGGLVFHPEYEVIVPIKFDNIHIEYSELVEDLNEDLNEPLEYFTNIQVKAEMDIVNTIPFGVTLTAKALDVYGQEIEGVEVEDVQIAAGNGEPIDEVSSPESQTQKFTLVIKSKGDVLRDLDQLELLVKGDADETVGGKALSPNQGIHITNVVLEISGDIETDLDEL